MNCKLANDYMMAYFDNMLDDIQAAQLKQHLKVCHNCSTDFESLNGVFDFLKNESFIEPPGNFEEEVMKKIGDMEAAREKRTDNVLIFIYSFVTLSLMLLTMLFFADLKGISILKVLDELIGSFNSISGIITVSIKVVNALGSLLSLIWSIILEVVLMFVKTYFVILAGFLSIIFAACGLYFKMGKQGPGGTR